MSYQRGYGQEPTPTIRAGLSVQELKAMTAMRMATTNEPQQRNYATNMNASKFPAVNPASSYQTATPQQLQAAGIQPMVLNNRQPQQLQQQQQYDRLRPVQRQNSQSLFGAGLSHIEDNSSSYFSRPGATLQTPQQQAQLSKQYATAKQTSLSPYHQQILVGAAGSRPMQSNISGRMRQDESMMGLLGQQQQVHSPINFGSSGSSSLASRAEQQLYSSSGLGSGRDLNSLLYSQQQQLQPLGGQHQLEQEDDHFQLSHLDAPYSRAPGSRLPQQSPQQSRLFPEPRVRSVAPLIARPAHQQQQVSSDDESDYALNSMLARYEGGARQNPAVSVPPGFVPSDGHGGELGGLFGQQGDGGSGDFGVLNDEPGDFFGAQQQGAFADLSQLDSQVSFRHATHSGASLPRMMGTICKSRSQPLIPLASLSPAPSSAAPQQQVTALTAMRTPANIVLPDVSELSPHTSRENTPKFVAASRASPLQQYSPPYVTETTQQQQQQQQSRLFGAQQQQQQMATVSPGGAHFPLFKARTQPRLGGLLGSSPLNSPALQHSGSGGGLFGRKALPSADGSEDDLLAAEMAMSVLDVSGATPQGTPGPHSGKSFHFTKDVNEFRSGLAAPCAAQKFTPPAAEWGAQRENGHNHSHTELQQDHRQGDTHNHATNHHSNNNEEEDDMLRFELFSRGSSGDGDQLGLLGSGRAAE